MNANYTLQSQDLTNTANKFESCAEELGKLIENLDSLMSDLNSSWNDANAQVYIRRFEELKQAFPAFKQNVNNYGTFLKGVVETYRREFMDEVSSSVNSTN